MSELLIFLAKEARTFRLSEVEVQRKSEFMYANFEA